MTPHLGVDGRVAAKGDVRTYSARAWLVVLFVIAALVLGGGGSPNPTTELVLELLFVGVATAWFWLPGNASPAARPDRLVWLLIAVPLVIPLLQLVPLPPSIWTALPAREDELAALSLVGHQASWRPISISPARTFAALLAIVPAVACTYAVSWLDIHERRLVLLTIVAMAIVSSLLGAFQLVAGDRGINLYPEFHAGWVTGFQANRNATADVLLIGLLAMMPLAAPYFDGTRQRMPLRFDRRAFAFLIGAIATFLAAAVVMTGSRAGTVLLLVPIAAVLATASLARDRPWRLPPLLLIAVAALVILFAAYLLGFSQNSALGRVGHRFWFGETGRADIWKDAWFALKQYWPVGFGLGGFEPAMVAFERLDFVDSLVPNRAHNEYIEIGLEAGLLGYAMVSAAAAACIALARRAWRGNPGLRRQIVFALAALAVIALHSIVDYPLRSMALACLAGVAGGALARKSAPSENSMSAAAGEKMEGLA